jgi:UDP-GlcNAc:undecaprenyl-phosphate/decaprenyl-phosphate GlcNAc-1-phosphate transferase
MNQQLSAAITSFCITFLLTPLLIKFLSERHIVDEPGGRKIHRGAKPSLGGVAIFVSFLCSALIWINLHDWKFMKFLLLAQGIIFFIGVRDDLLPLKASHKLLGQLMAASVAIFFFDIRIKSCFGFLGIQELPEVVSYIISYVFIIGVTNSFNLIDGLDGLAGSIAFVMFLTFGIWFFLADDKIYSVLSFALLGGILAFLVFNWQPSSIFMGDTGSLFIGLTVSIFTVHFMNVNDGLPAAAVFKFQNTIAVAGCIIIIPVVDTLRIIILRIARGQSPFKPDKSHVHHAIMRLGLTHSKATLLLIGVQVLFISVAVGLKNWSDLYVVPGVAVLALALSLALDKLINDRVYR